MKKLDEQSKGQYRYLRVGERIRHLLNQALREQKAWDPILENVSITILEVRMSKNLCQATAFILPLGGQPDLQDNILTALNKLCGYCRKFIANGLGLQRVPGLRFKWDHSIEQAQKIESLLKMSKIKQDLICIPT